MRSFIVSAVLLTASAAGAATLQEQVDALQDEIKYIKDNYERSEPVEIVKPVTEWVSPTGELFTSPQPNNVSPTDGSKLEERQTYRKIKFNRRESVGDKIDSAVNAALDGRVAVGFELLGQYVNTVGAGDVVDADGQTRNANRGGGTAGVNVNFTGRPMRNTIIFADLDAASGGVSLGEAWMLVQGPKKVLGLQVGFLDLAGSFDSNKIANDESSQFMSPVFVNSSLLGNDGAAGAVLRADFTRYHFAVGAQDVKGGSTDLFDDLYWIAEAGYLYNLLGDGHIRVWARQLTRQPNEAEQDMLLAYSLKDQALGVSYDHRLSTKLTLFGRYAKNSYVELFVPGDPAIPTDDVRVALNALDWEGSGGLEIGYFCKSRLHDKIGMGYAYTEQQGGVTEQNAELYYKAQLTGGLGVSLHGASTFSRTVADAGAAALDPLTGDPTLNDALPNLWTVGIRVLASY